MTLRTRILLTVAPLLLLTAGLGAADAVLLYQMGRGIDDILRDNLRSVDYMVDLHSALDDIDDSLHLALQGRDGARRQYEAGWKNLKKQQDLEEHNVTILPREQELVDELAPRVVSSCSGRPFSRRSLRRTLFRQARRRRPARTAPPGARDGHGNSAAQ